MSDDLERRLRESLHAEHLPPAPETLRAFLQRLPADAEPIALRTRPRPAWVAGTVAAAVIVGLLVAVVARTSKPPAASPGPPIGIEWMKVASTGDPALAADDTVMSAVALDRGYVMVGDAGRADHAVWWSSADGRNWARHDADPVFADSLLSKVIRTSRGLLILGTANRLDAQCAGGVLGCNPVSAIRIWLSADGQSWHSVPASALAVFGRAQLWDVASGPDGLVAVGAQVPPQGASHGMIWTSSDGLSWRATQFSSSVSSEAVDQVVATDSGYVATGLVATSNSEHATWFSPDGRDWLPATGADAINGPLVGALGAALSVTGAAKPQLLVTRDSASWRSAPTPPFRLGVGAPFFLTNVYGIFALGTGSTTDTDGAWSSTDGEQWLPVPEVDPPSATVLQFGPAALRDHGIVLVTAPTTGASDTESLWFGAFTGGPTRFSHASTWGLSFDYPADWTLSEANVNEHYITVLGFVGSGTGSVPCAAITPPPSQTYPYGIECHTVLNLPPESVLVEFQLFEGLASDSPQFASPPAGYEQVTVGGLPAFFSKTGQPFAGGDEILSWILSAPGNHGASYHLTAGIRGPEIPRLEAQVQAMVASVKFIPATTLSTSSAVPDASP